jgi:hypothetical protein
VRESYHQSPGNPVQADRLPDTLPDTEFPVPDASRSVTVATAVYTAMLLVIVWCFGRLLDIPSGEHLSYVIVAAIILLFASLRMTEFQYSVFCILFVVVVFVSCFVSLPIPFAAWRTVACVLLGGLAAELMTHWGLICTCSPVPRVPREAARRRWHYYALATQTAVPLASVLAEFVPYPHAALVFLAAWSLVSGGQAVLAAGRAACWRVARSVWTSWLTYNPHRHAAPGLLRIRWRRLTGRLVWVLAALYLVARAHAHHPDRGFWVADLAVDLLVTFAVPTLLALPVLVEADAGRADPRSPGEWERLVLAVRRSACPIERDSLYLGWAVADGSPVLVPRGVFTEHAHFLGDSGSGKTSLGLLPWLEQMVAFGDSSFVVLDMKGDSAELLATLHAAADRARNHTGRAVPVKHFSTRTDHSTFAYNPLTQPFWDRLDPLARTDHVQNAAGMFYGTGYGPGYFTSAIGALLHYVLTKHPNVRTFRELADRTRHAVATASPRDLRPEVKSAGIHLLMVLDRLAACEALNVGPDAGDADIRTQALDFTAPFRDPCVYYFQLPSTLTPGIAPEVGRLAIASLLTAAATIDPANRRQVYLVIDEFQRVVAHNLEALLQLARSMNVGVILANQTMQDLKQPDLDMIPTLESNCRFRQWFAVSSSADRKRLSDGSGLTVEQKGSFDYGPLRPDWTWLWKLVWPSATFSEEVKPRLSENDILLATDHPFRSVLTVTRGAGYAQYGGLPLIVESRFHIPEQEYRRRRVVPWPGPGGGAFVPRTEPAAGRPNPTRVGPRVTGEVLGGDPLAGLDDLFGIPGSPPPRTPRRKELDQ